MPRPILATISLAAVRHNLSIVKKHAPHARIWAVLKANAYGHGLERVLPACSGADGLAMLDLDEAVRSRACGYAGPILLLEGFFSLADLALVHQLKLTVALHCEEQMAMLATLPPGAGVSVYLKVNSGMNRLGFVPQVVASVFERLRAMPQIGEVTFMTHFSSAEIEGGTRDAILRFDEATRGLPGLRSMSNSAATLFDSRAHRDWVRPGIMIYGASPSALHSAASLHLKPAMTLTSQVIALQDLKVGDRVGYGGRFKATRTTRLAVIACGYADGYPRVAPDGTPVVINGVRAPLSGQVSMDMITVDVTDVPNVHLGTEVELFGGQVSVDEVGAHAGTSGYELLCALAPRVPIAKVI
jgi:alanine racemase